MMLTKNSKGSVVFAADCLLKGGIAVLPTDTVYGFSGIVDVKGRERFKTDDTIRSVKGRSETKPLIQLISKPEDIFLFTDDVIPQKLLSLWPGPLTLIVNVKAESPLAFDAGTVAFRCPGDEWLRSVIALCGAPVYSTSVNLSGCPVLDTVSEIEGTFGKSVDLIVDDGDKKNAVPSTIVSLCGESPVVVRKGSLDIDLS